MNEMKPSAAVSHATTLIGDLIGSRGSADRRRLHATFAAVLDRVNTELRPPTPVRMQVGDEYQGVFASLGDALHASLTVRLAMLPGADVRHGIGRGSIEVLSEEPRVEDGPGWWAARGAIERVEEAERGRGSARCARRTSRPTTPRSPAARRQRSTRRSCCATTWSAACRHGRCRCCVVCWSGRSGRPGRGAGISPSAVSQRVRADGLAAIIAAHDLTRGMR